MHTKLALVFSWNVDFLKLLRGSRSHCMDCSPHTLCKCLHFSPYETHSVQHNRHTATSKNERFWFHYTYRLGYLHFWTNVDNVRRANASFDYNACGKFGVFRSLLDWLNSAISLHFGVLGATQWRCGTATNTETFIDQLWNEKHIQTPFKITFNLSSRTGQLFSSGFSIACARFCSRWHLRWLRFTLCI